MTKKGKVTRQYEKERKNEPRARARKHFQQPRVLTNRSELIRSPLASRAKRHRLATHSPPYIASSPTIARDAPLPRYYTSTSGMYAQDRALGLEIIKPRHVGKAVSKGEEKRAPRGFGDMNARVRIGGD